MLEQKKVRVRGRADIKERDIWGGERKKERAEIEAEL
jgi:hypothetical protein